MLLWEGREKLAQGRLIVFPARDRPLVDRLADLHDTGGADRTFRAMKLETGGFPGEAARRHQPPGHRLEIGHGLFVIHLVDR